MKINVGLTKKIGHANYGSLEPTAASSSRPTSDPSKTRKLSAARSSGPTPPAARRSTMNWPDSRANARTTATGLPVSVIVFSAPEPSVCLDQRERQLRRWQQRQRAQQW